MGLGVLNTREPNVPGTAKVLDGDRPVKEARLGEHEARGFKHGTYGGQQILLVPQPTDDPNDPLVRSFLHHCWKGGTWTAKVGDRLGLVRKNRKEMDDVDRGLWDAKWLWLLVGLSLESHSALCAASGGTA
jgi:hypothetical protein